MIKIDIGARKISSDQKVWRLFPGSGYRFLKSFTSSDVAFLDFPGIRLPEKDIKSSKDLIKLIAMSSKYKTTLRSEEDGQNIELTFSDFEDAKHTNNRNRLKQALINFYQEAKAGDLVIMPEPSANRMVWIGEFLDNAVVYESYPTKVRNVYVPSRRVKWIKNVRENTLSYPLTEALRNQHAFTLIEKSKFIEVMSIAYSSFIFNEQHVSTIYNGDDFLDSDSAFLGTVSKLVSAAYEAAEKKENGLGRSIIDILLSSTPTEFTCAQESDIHSAGFTRLISATPVAIAIAVTVVALFALSGCKDENEYTKQIPELTLINGASHSDAVCNAKVSDVVKRILETMPIDQITKLCNNGRLSEERAKLRSSAKKVN